MDVHSPDALFQALRDSGLHEPAALAVLDTLPPELRTDLPTLADRLIAAGLLNAYQGRKVRIGRIVELLLGPYLILDKIGEGGMGKVYKAVQRRVGRVVALKVVRPHLMSNKTVMRRYKREVAAASKLNHPNIVSVFDADDFNGRHYLAMEFVDGSDLSRLVKEFGPLPYPEACEYVRQAALGLQSAHDGEFVHRDIKPSNLLVSGERALPGTGGRANVKILDMGLVRSLSDEEDVSRTELTRDGTVVGTPDYMAPEQAKNSSTVGPPADLYSLGGTLYYLLVGKPPFPDGTAIDKLLRHQMDPPPDVRAARPDVPPAVAAVIDRLLAKNPDDRYGSADAVAEVLNRFCTDSLAEPLMAEVVSHTGGPDSPGSVPDGPTEPALETGGRLKAAARPRPARPVGIPRPRPGGAGSSSLSQSDESFLAARRKRRKGSKGILVWGLLLGGLGLLAAVAAVLPRPVIEDKPPVVTGTGGEKEPPVPPKPPPDPPPPVVGLAPVSWLLPDQTVAALVVHPAAYWRVEREKNLIRPDGRLAAHLNGLRDKFQLDLRGCERLIVAVAGGTVTVVEGPMFAAPDWPARVKSAAGGKEMKVGPTSLAVFAAPGRPAVYAGLPAPPGHAAGYALGPDNKLVAAVCKRAAAGRNPNGVPVTVLAAVHDDGGSPPPLLTFVASGDWRLPGDKGLTLGEYGVTSLIVKVRSGPERFDVEAVAYADSRRQLQEFFSLAVAKRLGDDFPAGKSFLVDLVEPSTFEFSDAGSQTRLKSITHWPLGESHEWAEELLAAAGG